MSETAKYSVFFDDGNYQHNADDQEEFADAGLGQIVALAAVRWPNCTPVAWAPAWPGGGKSSHQIREESIAAGRVIEFKDGKCIARGLAGLIRAQQAGKADSHCAMRDSDTNPKPALTWNTKTPFDPFKGWGPVRRYDADDYMPAVSTGHPLQKLGDTSNPLHGSFALVKKD